MRSLTRQSPCAKMKTECSKDQMEMQTADHLVLFGCKDNRKILCQCHWICIRKESRIMMELDIENSYYGQKAKKLFLEGYNCSQSVFLAFEDKYDMDHSMAMKMSSSFGGGMGRLREVCGAVSGMFMVAGLLYGYDEPKNFEAKSEHYARIQELAGEYRERNGSIVCREILGLGKGKDDPVPSRRTKEYYQKRPCPDLVAMAAAIMEEYIRENPLEG